jgi:hypothetical protein
VKTSRKLYPAQPKKSRKEKSTQENLSVKSKPSLENSFPEKLSHCKTLVADL